MNKVTMKGLALGIALLFVGEFAQAEETTKDSCPWGIWESSTTGWTCLLDTENWKAELPECGLWEVNQGDVSQLWVCKEGGSYE